MALVHHNQVKVVGRVLAKVGRGHAVLVCPTHEGLKDGEEHRPVLGHLACFANGVRTDAHQRPLIKGGKPVEVIKSLARQVVAVGQKQHTRLARGIPLQAPPRLKQLPHNLKRNGGFARARGQRQQNALLPRSHTLQHAVNRNFLVIAQRPRAAFVLKRHSRKPVAPLGAGRVRLVKGLRPQRLGAGVVGHVTLKASGHVHAVNLLPIAGIGKTHRQLAGIALGLGHALGVGLAPGFGLYGGQLGVAVNEHIVGNLGLGPLPTAQEPPRRNLALLFAQDARPLHHAPACRF